jgi:hypothetical protein
MKGTIRVRENRDGSKRYVCQVKLGRDPGTGTSRVLTGTAKSERAAHRLLLHRERSTRSLRHRSGPYSGRGAAGVLARVTPAASIASPSATMVAISGHW